MLAQTLDSPAARRRQMYERGATPAYACRADPRFSYCLYVPPSFDDDSAGHDLVVVMHGSGRTMETYRDRFAAFGQYRRCVILAPLFPVGPLGDGNPHGFKVLQEARRALRPRAAGDGRRGRRDARHALRQVPAVRLFRRRALRAPLLLPAPAAAACGVDRRAGVGDLARRQPRLVGRHAQRAGTVRPRHRSRRAARGARAARGGRRRHSKPGRSTIRATACSTRPASTTPARTRIERLATLADNLARHGIEAQHVVVPNVPHDGPKVLPYVQTFFEAVLVDIERA